MGLILGWGSLQLCQSLVNELYDHPVGLLTICRNYVGYDNLTTPRELLMQSKLKRNRVSNSNCQGRLGLF